jgi:hypothetical protein
MDGKKKVAAATVAVGEAAAQAALRRGPARELESEEDNVIRMRLGASVRPDAPLPRKLENLSRFTDTEIELLAYEIEAFQRIKMIQRARPVPAPASTPSRAKEKIIRALRRKK